MVCKQEVNSVLSGGVGRQASYSGIKLLRSDLRARKDTELSSEDVPRSVACFQQKALTALARGPAL